jgi:hypothetical protein
MYVSQKIRGELVDDEVAKEVCLQVISEQRVPLISACHKALGSVDEVVRECFEEIARIVTDAVAEKVTTPSDGADKISVNLIAIVRYSVIHALARTFVTATAASGRDDGSPSGSFDVSCEKRFLDELHSKPDETVKKVDGLSMHLLRSLLARMVDEDSAGVAPLQEVVRQTCSVDVASKLEAFAHDLVDRQVKES